MQLNKKSAEKEESERDLLAEIKDKSEELVELSKENCQNPNSTQLNST